MGYERGTLRPLAFTGVSVGKIRKGRVSSLGSASLNNFGELRALGVISSYLVPTLG